MEKARYAIENRKDKFFEDNGGYKAYRVTKWVSKETLRELNKFDVEPFKDSLVLDFGMAMASYLNLKGVDSAAGFPEVRSRPVYFCRYDTTRDYSILYDGIKNRYYAKLYLMNSRDEYRSELQHSGTMKLKYLDREDEYLELTGRKERYILVPLCFGKWQEEYLKQAIACKGMLKTARLIKRRNEYYLSISIDLEDGATIETINYLGISRGIKNEINYTVVSMSDGLEGKTGYINFKAIDKSTSNYLHEMSSAIAKLAVDNKAQVIVESLNMNNDRLGYSDEYKPAISAGIYNKMTGLIEYKLKSYGLPPPVLVSSVGIFYRCHVCRNFSYKNRQSESLFICTNCGTVKDIEQLGSINVARKLIEYNKTTIKMNAEVIGDKVRVSNSILEVEFILEHDMLFFERLVEELKKIVENFDKNRLPFTKEDNLKKKLSLMKKIQNAEDLRSVIEIV
jgi:putative transposase